MSALSPIARFHRGFSLIEIMIGLLIGALSSLVVLQMFALSEQQKRTISESGNSLVNGALALDALESELRKSGYGPIANANLIGCDVVLPSGASLATLVPTAINPPSIPAGDANTDRLLVAYGSGSAATEEVTIIAQPGLRVYTVDTPMSFSSGDRVIVENGRTSPCNLRVDTVASVSGANVTVVTGVSGMAKGRLYNLGRVETPRQMDQSPQIMAYAIRGGNLTACDYILNDCSSTAAVADPTVWVPIANNIVSLRAQYGRDTTTVSPTRDGIVDFYDQAVAVPPAVSSITCGWARIVAIRLAMVARSPQFEHDTVTTVAPTWSGSVAVTNRSAAAPITLSADANWQHYRYRVFETLVPLRNMAWIRMIGSC